MKKKLLSLALAFGLTLSLAACSGGNAGTAATPTPPPSTETPAVTGAPEAITLKIGATPAPHAEVLEVVKTLLAEQGITLEIKVFDDYIQPNSAVEDGSLDANYFQHITYMNEFNAEHGTHLVSVGDIHYEPFGLYAGKTATVAELKDGAQIAVPNDGTNEARALMLLEAQGLITIKEGVGLSATKLDIAENPHNYDIVELEAKQITARLADVDLAVINGNYALGAGLTSEQALAFEDASASTAPYVNVLTVKEGRESDPAILALTAALQSDEVKAFMEKTYGEAVRPVF